MDCITITNLEVFAHHGVFPEENEKGQNFYINAKLYLSTRKAGLADELSQSVHYGEVCELIDKHMREHTYKLLETVAEQLAAEIFESYPLVERLHLEICKPHAPISLPFENVSVAIKRGWQRAFVAFGSNMGDRRTYVEEALAAMKEHKQIRVQKISSVYETKPYGGVAQEDFLNGAVMIDTLLYPRELLTFLQELEQKAGRERLVHWGPRTLDLDILFYGDRRIWEEDLIIPHPDMQNRDFVLEPMAEIAPYFIHPVYGKSMKEMQKELNQRES
ncbi:MAG: 2-amino-4-hydroxy-6-hydroxymethyldihydropteridine diphosphokinase [Roseburia sp.]|nr:2-amino-4-hydroxy-6-hydroxymethyldihydropteridine diphosphokinase [Roseburia sp.]MCM1277902.1 2-amino-4-hydroxy-6-hydroxymethyldihydropteridine diphosphokinase [Robinsoniella sp.]